MLLCACMQGKLLAKLSALSLKYKLTCTSREPHSVKEAMCLNKRETGLV